jgi:dihydroorotate dehydrogenase (NAD+) catalytic subunit
MADLRVQVAPRHSAGLLLRNPVMTASGTFGYGIEYAGIVNLQSLGAIVCKGTTLHPRDGNPQPRIYETDSGLLNAIGLQNIGVDDLVKEKAPIWATWEVPVIVNIAGETKEEYGQVAARLDGVDGVSAIEVNISCPNVTCGGMEFGTDPKIAAEVTMLVKRSTELPVIVKLSPNVTDIREIARAVVDVGADAVCLINTLRSMAVNIETAQPVLGNITGGLSGRALKPVALAMVYMVAEAIDVPIIGCGGITCADDAIEFLMAGASAVQVGTATLRGPGIALEVLQGIEQFMNKKKYNKLEAIIGAARKKRPV